tara:strand:- start:376 stop:621 length:246 start_codon:yes stop_codon:yes gene_type:complete
MIKLTVKQKCLLNDLLEIEINNVYKSIKNNKDETLIDAELDYIIECKLIKSKLELDKQEKEIEKDLYGLSLNQEMNKDIYN